MKLKLITDTYALSSKFLIDLTFLMEYQIRVHQELQPVSKYFYIELLPSGLDVWDHPSKVATH